MEGHDTIERRSITTENQIFGLLSPVVGLRSFVVHGHKVQYAQKNHQHLESERWRHMYAVHDGVRVGIVHHLTPTVDGGMQAKRLELAECSNRWQNSGRRYVCNDPFSCWYR